jgi:hypothetical protein
MARLTTATPAHGEPGSMGRWQLIGAWARGDSEHGSSPAGVQQREGEMGIQARASLGLGRRWRGGAMEAMKSGGLSSPRG